MLVAAASGPTTGAKQSLVSTGFALSEDVLFGWAGSLSRWASVDGGSGALPLIGGSGDGGSTPGRPGSTILATSAAVPSVSTSLARPLLSDRKSFFAHCHPRPFLISIIRLSSLTASTIFASYVTDQIEYETSNEKLVQAGDITTTECDARNKQWEELQWQMRWGTFKQKAMVGWVKYQVTILIMRLYEKVAEGSKVGIETLDRLTMDTMKAGVRTCEAYGYSSSSGGGGVNTSATKLTSQGAKEVRSEMIPTCLWANLIAFAADATVQLGILSYGYYVYYKGRQARIRTDEEVKLLAGQDEGEEIEEEVGVEVTVQGEVMDDTDANVADAASADVAAADMNSSTTFGTDEDMPATVVPPSDADLTDVVDRVCLPKDGWAAEEASTPKDEDNEEGGAMALSYLLKTVRIIVSRSVGLVAASYGGAYGTTLWPGWGTLLGTSVADSMVSSVLD